TADQIQRELSAPFAAGEIRNRPGAVRGNRAQVIHYIDVRAVMNRLDQGFGVGGWQTSYREATGGVVCHLKVRVPDGSWCEHEDIGSYSDQADAGDKAKAAYSDALKRVAVHLGIGRFLYSLPVEWTDIDPKTRKFLKPPRLARSA